MVAKYITRVHARNRNADYGIPVTVYADSVTQAMTRAVELGWGGRPRDALVTIFEVHEVSA